MIPGSIACADCTHYLDKQARHVARYVRTIARSSSRGRQGHYHADPGYLSRLYLTTETLKWVWRRVEGVMPLGLGPLPAPGLASLSRADRLACARAWPEQGRGRDFGLRMMVEV